MRDPITIPTGADVRPVLLAALRVNGPVEISNVDLGEAAIDDMRGEVELIAVPTEAGCRYEVRPEPAPAAELTPEQQQYAAADIPPAFVVEDSAGHPWLVCRRCHEELEAIENDDWLETLVVAARQHDCPEPADTPAQDGEQAEGDRDLCVCGNPDNCTCAPEDPR